MEKTEKHATVYVCRAKSCTRRGAAELAAGLQTTFARKGADVQVLRHDCFDLCKGACNVLVELPGAEPNLYTRLHPRQAGAFAESILQERSERKNVVQEIVPEPVVREPEPALAELP